MYEARDYKLTSTEYIHMVMRAEKQDITKQHDLRNGTRTSATYVSTRPNSPIVLLEKV
jgi:hypothetical protein